MELSKTIKKIKQWPQSQISTNEQVLYLIALGNKYGLYDAVDYLKAQKRYSQLLGEHRTDDKI